MNPLAAWVLPVVFAAAAAVFLIRSVMRARRGLDQYRGVMRSHQGLCGTCGYDLRGNPAARCPECGTVSRWKSD